MRSAFLNFKCESTSQKNCRVNFDNLLLLFGVCVFGSGGSSGSSGSSGGSGT